MRRARRWPGIVLVAAAVACGGDSVGPDAGELVIQPTAVTIGQQESLQLNVAVVDADGALLAGSPVTFQSSDTLIATVTAIGMVHSPGPAGHAVITVKSGRVSSDVPVTVTSTSTSIAVTPSVAVIPQLGSVQLNAQLLDVIGTPILHDPFIYASANPAIATVSASGLVTSSGPSGEVAITVSYGALSAQVGVAIQQVPTLLALTPDPLSLPVNGSGQLSAHVYDAVHMEMLGIPVTYLAGPASLITVNGSGRVQSVGGEGSGTATAQAAGLAASVAVHVTAVGHPSGTIAATTAMPGIPWGGDISSAGVAYIIGINSVLGRADLPAFGIATVTIPAGNTTEIAFNHAGTQAWVANSPAGSLALYNPATNGLVATVSGLTGDVYGVLVSATDATVYAGTGDGVLYAINTSSRTIQWQVNVGFPVIHMAAHPTQQLLYAGTQAGEVEVDLVTHTTRLISVAGVPQAVAVAADGSELYVANEYAGLSVYSFGTGLTQDITIGCGGYGLVLTPDNAQLYVSCPADGLIKVIDRASKTVVSTITTTGQPRRLAISADGQTVLAPNAGGWVDFIR